MPLILVKSSKLTALRSTQRNLMMESGKRNAAAKLPAELDYLIIDRLSGDKTSLSACSRVCRSWAPVARSHLFRSLDIQSTASNARISAFKEFLQTSPDVCALIEDLTLSCDRFASFKRKRPEQVSLLSIHVIVMLLPKLQRLTLAGVSLQPKPLNAPDLPLASIPHLHRLRVFGCYFHDEDMSLALDAARLFASLGELQLGGYWPLEDARGSSVTKPPRLKIEHVHYDSLGAAPTVMLSDFLRASSIFEGLLKSLHFTWSTWAEVMEYQKILVDAAPHLKRIEFEPKEQFWENGAPGECFYFNNRIQSSIRIMLVLVQMTIPSGERLACPGARSSNRFVCTCTTAA